MIPHPEPMHMAGLHRFCTILRKPLFTDYAANSQTPELCPGRRPAAQSNHRVRKNTKIFERINAPVFHRFLAGAPFADCSKNVTQSPKSFVASHRRFSKNY